MAEFSWEAWKLDKKLTRRFAAVARLATTPHVCIYSLFTYPWYLTQVIARRKIQLLAEHPCHPVPGEEIDNR
ncbi:hypothetical protein MGG_17048 [Pyricularia oryzae 70-15]|uniref:Uncharacterized protein n=1 Tax=Pyricularia oryzae (strain 70-15 / ATCC MYA-4617 / FGSC 8958) TaxID=242507 RepID=G4N679_PYRO7|nr:uncharacterized protein MGG_17048 [Pyricularia oryzae 70-15]EHA49803.1 hypothetical protein MGG_17048 [Pyricularia oryzae 70-15]